MKPVQGSRPVPFVKVRNQKNPFVFAGVALAVASVLTPNVLLTAAAGATFAFLWWNALNSPTRMVMACMLSVQWLQVSAKLALANLFGISLNEPSTTSIGATTPLEVGEATAAAIYLALAGVASVSLGARWLLPRIQINGYDFAHLSPMKLFALYLPLLIVAELASPIFGGPLAQIILNFGFLRFVPIALLVGVYLFTRQGGVVLASIVALEVLLGFMSFFSEWKTILIVTFVAVFSIAGNRWSRHLPILIGGLVSLVALGALWTAIKPTYREALSGGTRQQAILLSPAEQSAALSREISSVDAGDFATGTIDLFTRVSYVDYLSDALERVPSQIEHQGGALWGEALQQFLMPRFLFPDKPPLPSDSERTMYFTGHSLATEGTSISIGYVGESYIDFGIGGALAIPFLIGVAFALGVAMVARVNPGDRALIFAVSIPLLWTAQQFEISNVKLVGVAWTWIASLLMVLLWRWIKPMLQLSDPRVRGRLAHGSR